jgi:hypothetical protein
MNKGNNEIAGVHFDSKRNKYMSAIFINGKHINLGRFYTKEIASQVYNTAINFSHLFDGDMPNFRNTIKSLI